MQCSLWPFGIQTNIHDSWAHRSNCNGRPIASLKLRKSRFSMCTMPVMSRIASPTCLNVKLPADVSKETERASRGHGDLALEAPLHTCHRLHVKSLNSLLIVGYLIGNNKQKAWDSVSRSYLSSNVNLSGHILIPGCAAPRDDSWRSTSTC